MEKLRSRQATIARRHFCASKNSGVKTLGVSRCLGAGEVLNPGPAWHMPRHSHAHHEMIIICGGEMEVEIRGQRLRGCGGEAFLYPAGESHEEWTDPARVVHTIFVAFRCRLPGDHLPLHTQDSGGRLRQIAAWLLQERDCRELVADDLRNALIAALIAEYVRLATSRREAWGEYIRNFIREHLDQRITLNALAAYAHMSKYHFLRRYRRVAGRTPMAEVRILRLEFARDLLLTTHLPLKAIAARAGLSDHYHLSKLFRQYFNLCPSELRRFRPAKRRPKASQ